VASPASNASRAAETDAGSTAAPAPSPVNRPAADVVSITTRDDFLLELGEALVGQAAVHPVDSMAAALEHVAGAKRGQVLVIDSRDVADIRADLERAQTQAPHAVVLVFADADAEKQIGATVKGTNVFAVLPIPLDRRKTAAVLESAMADAIAKKPARSPERSAAVSVEAFNPRPDSAAPAGASTSDRSGSKSKAVLWAVVGLATVTVAVGAYWLFGGGKKGEVGSPAAKSSASAPTLETPTTDDAALAPKPTVDTSIVQGKVDDLLEKARLAMRERRYSEPAGDNALLYYRSAAAADPTNGEATDGLQRVAAVLASRFEEAMTGGRYDEAGVALANLKAAAPKDARIAPLELKLATAQISKALADGNVDRAAALVRLAQQSAAIAPDQIVKWRTEIGRRQEDAKIQRIAGLVSERMRDGRLLEPADDCAKVYLQQLHDLAPTNSTTQRLIRDLNAAYLHKAREAGVAGRAGDVDRWLSEAKAGGVSAAEITSFQRELTGARQKAIAAESDRLAQLSRERIRDGKLTDPAQDSAAYYAGQIQTADGSYSGLSQLTRDLAAKLLERARASAQAGKATSVEADLTQAKRWGADPKDILAVQQIQNAPKGSAGSRSSTAGASAAALAGALKRVRYVAPDYPSTALAQRMGGSVTVECTVDVHGDTRDVRVIDATPPGVFDRAAISAVKRWHYEPVVQNGTPVEIPVRTTIRFEPPK